MGRIRGIRAAAGSALCIAGPAVAQVRYDNGPLLTSANTCAVPPASMISEMQLNDSSTGFNDDASIDSRLADDFQVSEAGGWRVTGFTLYAYEVGQGPTGNQFTRVNLRIWNGRPGQPGSSVIFGDTTTNVMTGFSFANIYRVSRTGIQCSTDRAVCAITCAVAPLTLLPGTYWLDWQITSPSALSGPWVPPVTINGLPAKPGSNGQNYLPASGTWGPVHDQVSGEFQDFPFQVLGTLVNPPTCYANCDLSTTPPVLNVNDFSCFLNKFVSGDSYANCDGSTAPPVLNINDFVCYLNLFTVGCS